MTKRQAQILGIIQAFIKHNGHSPSYAEIAELAELRSLATVHKHISALRKRGLLSSRFNCSRSIRTTGKCPMCGRGKAK